MMYDVAVVGGGIAGLATAARLQASGLSTIIFEAHGQPGGCAGFFRRRGFSFDVGATTLVDFERGGVGGELLEEIGMESIPGEPLPGYVAWLPDRKVVLYRDPKEMGTRTTPSIGRVSRTSKVLGVDRSLVGRFLGGQPPRSTATDSEPFGCATHLPMRGTWQPHAAKVLAMDDGETHCGDWGCEMTSRFAAYCRC